MCESPSAGGALEINHADAIATNGSLLAAPR
jgi:hypothetical protein